MLRSLPLPLAASLLLAACSGGGGGNNGSASLPLDRTPVAFTAFSAINPSTLVAFGSGGTTNYQATRDDVNGVDSGGTVTNETGSLNLFFNASTDPRQAELTVTFPADPDLVAAFTAAPTEVGHARDFVRFSDDSDRLTVHSPANAADELEYLTYGAWALGMESTTVNLGSATFGRLTTAGEMAGVGVLNATYLGALLGTLVEPDGDVLYYEADSEIEVDFFNNLVRIGSSDTRNLETGVLRTGLNIANDTDATLAGSAFTGGAFSLQEDGVATGSFGGNFFGPNAEEAGAAFEIERPIGRYFGTLGGKR